MHGQQNIKENANTSSFPCVVAAVTNNNLATRKLPFQQSTQLHPHLNCNNETTDFQEIIKFIALEQTSKTEF